MSFIKYSAPFKKKQICEHKHDEYIVFSQNVNVHMEYVRCITHPSTHCLRSKYAPVFSLAPRPLIVSFNFLHIIGQWTTGLNTVCNERISTRQWRIQEGGWGGGGGGTWRIQRGAHLPSLSPPPFGNPGSTPSYLPCLHNIWIISLWRVRLKI